EGLGPIRVARHLHLLPARHVVVYFVLGLFQFILQFRQGSAHVYLCFVGYLVYLVNLHQQIGMGFSKSNVVSIHAVLQKSAAKLGNCLDYLKMSDDDGQKTTASIGNGLVFASISFGQLNYTFRLHLWSDLLPYSFWFRVFPLLLSRRKPIRV